MGHEEQRDSVRSSGNGVSIVRRLPEEILSFLYLRASSAHSCRRCRSLNDKSVFYTYLASFYKAHFAAKTQYVIPNHLLE